MVAAATPPASCQQEKLCHAKACHLLAHLLAACFRLLSTAILVSAPQCLEDAYILANFQMLLVLDAV